MKYKRLIAVALFIQAGFAFACDSYNCNTKAPDNYNTSTARSNATSHSYLNNQSPSSAEQSSSTKAVAVSFGAFAMAPLPPGLCDSTNPEYKRFAIPFLFDASEQKTNSLCPKIHMREYLVKTCQYADARQLDKAILSELIPNFQHDTDKDHLYVNLSPAACQAAQQPIQVPAPVIPTPPTTLEGAGLSTATTPSNSIAPKFKTLPAIVTKKKGC